MTPRLERFLGIGALTTSVVALIFSLYSNFLSQEANNMAQDANNIAREANNMAQDANNIAREANDIAQDANTIIAQEGQARVHSITEQEVPIYITLTACRNTSSNSYRVYEQAANKITFLNSGRAPASLLNAVFVFEVGERYDSEVFSEHIAEDELHTNLLDLPLAIFPGIAERWYFWAERYTDFSTKAEVLDYIEVLSSSRLGAGWVLVFSTGYIDVFHPSPVLFTVDPTLIIDFIENPC